MKQLPTDLFVVKRKKETLIGDILILIVDNWPFLLLHSWDDTNPGLQLIFRFNLVKHLHIFVEKLLLINPICLNQYILHDQVSEIVTDGI